MPRFCILLLLATITGNIASSAQDASGQDSAPTTTNAPAPTPEPTPERTTASPATPMPAPKQKTPTPAPKSILPTQAPIWHGSNSTNQTTGDFAKAVVDTIKKELQDSPFQPVIALIAFVFGLALVISGQKSFDFLICSGIGVVVCLLTKAEVQAKWTEVGTTSHSGFENDAWFVGVEAGVVAGFAAHKGYPGVLVAIGICGGVELAKVLLNVVFDLGVTQMHMAEVQIVWFSLFVLPATWYFYKEKHAFVLAIVMPIMGGGFMSSALWYGITKIFILAACPKGKCAGDLTPAEGKWINYLLLCLGRPTDGSDVGLFAGSDKNFQISGHEVYLDQVVTGLTWAIISLVSIKLQLGAHKKKRTRSTSERDSKAVPLLG